MRANKDSIGAPIHSNDEDDGGERACETGGNYGLCRAHPTCEMVHKMLDAFELEREHLIRERDVLKAECERLQEYLNIAMPNGRWDD